jgi:hypothetical protein
LDTILGPGRLTLQSGPRPEAFSFAWEHTVPTQIKIRTDADYLKAHVTVLHRGYGVRSFALLGLKHRVLSLVKKWIWATGAGKA